MAKALLGISPGTRIIGLAVISDGELVEWKVKSFKECWSRRKGKAILAMIDQLCEQHRIQAISVKKVDPLRSSPQLDRLIGYIVRQAFRNGIQVCEYSLSDLEYDARQEGRQTKKQLSEQIAIKHPLLKHTLLRERNNRTEYYTRMFEAVAMADRCRDE